MPYAIIRLLIAIAEADIMLDEIINKRGIPAVWDGKGSWSERREEIIQLLMREEYGNLPEAPTDLKFSVIEELPGGGAAFCAGRATLKKMLCSGKVCGREFSFPFYTALPKEKDNVPFFVHINFRPDVPDRYQPTEEILDNGFAVLSFCYEDVTTDDGDMTNGLADVLFGGENRKPNDPGKIMMWAWAASRVMDYAMSLDCLDKQRGAVAGHSRLGKTALVAAMTDERFYAAFSNDSGCSGAAISRDKQGENLEFICRTFPFWFCENYYKYANHEHDLPFDQHFLVAAIAPRRAYVASASEDLWADPESEYLSCVLAGKVYEKLGLKGFIADDEYPKPPKAYADGNIGYHVRNGAHYLSREDWNRYFEFLRKA